MTENNEDYKPLDFAMLKHRLDIEIEVCKQTANTVVQELLEDCRRAVGMAEIGIAAHAYSLTQIQELTAEVGYLRAVQRG